MAGSRTSKTNAEPTAEQVEAEVLAALERISSVTKAVKLHGTAKTPGVFLAQKPLQAEAAKFCMQERLIQEAGVVGKGKSASTGYIITEKGMNYKFQAGQLAFDRKWKAIESQVNTLVEEQNSQYQTAYLDKTKKIAELKCRFQENLTKKVEEQTQKFDRLMQQVRNTLKNEMVEQAGEAINQLIHAQSSEIELLIEDLKSTQQQLLGQSSKNTAKVPSSSHQDDFASAFKTAFEKLEHAQRRNFIKLVDLRNALPQFSHDEFSQGLNKLRRARVYSLDSSDGNVVSLTEEERAAAIVEMGTLLVYCKRI